MHFSSVAIIIDYFFFLMIRRPPRSTLFPTRRSSDLLQSRSDLVCRLLLVTGVDRKSTRLNSSHDQISYAVFCLKKKNKYTPHPSQPVTTTYRMSCSASESTLRTNTLAPE